MEYLKIEIVVSRMSQFRLLNIKENNNNFYKENTTNKKQGALPKARLIT
jgi:hypothetical protein